MKTWVGIAREAKGVALPLALFGLVMLSGLLVAFVSLTAMEPQISRNLSDVTQARYLAEAGIEYAFDQLSTNINWNALLIGNDGVANTADDGQVAAGIPLPGLGAASGTFAVTVRNDNQPGDNRLTGQPLDPGNGVTDTNNILIVTATGTLNAGTPQQLQRRIQVVISRLPFPPFPGAVNLPGLQADVGFTNGNWDIDGRDWACTANCSDRNPGNRTYALKADQSKMKVGIAVQSGNQRDVNKTYESRVEDLINGYNPAFMNNVKGKDQGSGSYTQGQQTIAPDDSLNPTVMQNFLTALSALPQTQVLQSTRACPMVLDGVPGQPTNPTLTNGCGMNQTLDLGTRDNPKLVYFRGELDTSSNFTGLRLNGPGSGPTAPPISGSGVLVVEDGDMTNWGEFNWDGIVIVTGRYVGFGTRINSNTTVYGALASSETIWNEYWNSPYGEFNLLDQTSATFRFSQQNIDMALRIRGLLRASSWREI